MLCVVFGVGQALVFRLTNDSSESIQRAMVQLNVVPLVASALVSGNVHQPSAAVFYPLVVAQWALVLWLVLSACSALGRRRKP